MSVPLLLAFLSYLCILMTIGLLAHRKNTTAADFMVGNRSVNFWVTALSAHASDMSSWLFMGFPMAIYVGGLQKSWIGFGLLLGMFLNWHFVAPRLRVATEKFQCYTLSDYFESRFGDKSGRLRILSALLLLVFTTWYLAAGLTSIGFLLQSLFGMDYHLAIVLATIVMLSYTSFGGFVAVAWTDFFQGIFLLLMILLVPFVGYRAIGGYEAILSAANLKQLSLSFVPSSASGAFSQGLEALAWAVGYFGMPHVLAKFMGISSANDMYKAKWLGTTWQIIALIAATAVALVGIAYFQELANPELLFVELVKDLFSPYVGGFILCGVIAATISTMDSQVLVVSGVLAEDFYKKLWHKEADEAQLLRAGRLAVVGVSCVALLIASYHSQTIYELVFYAWSGLGASFGPLVLMALHSKRASTRGAIAGLLTGGILSAFWPYANKALGCQIPPMLPGFFANFLMIYLLSQSKNDGETYDKRDQQHTAPR